MKTSLKILSLWLNIMICIMLVFSSCKKEKDYRDQWVGEWDFVVERSWSTYGWWDKDTINYLGKICCGNLYNELIIHYTEKSSVTLTVNERGELSGFPPDCTYAYGSIEETNKINIFLRWGGLGAGERYFIEGTKQRGGKE